MVDIYQCIYITLDITNPERKCNKNGGYDGYWRVGRLKSACEILTEGTFVAVCVVWIYRWIYCTTKLMNLLAKEVWPFL